jgi:hypothetical protein
MPRTRKTWVKKNAITRDASVVRANPSEWFLLDDGVAPASGQSVWGGITGDIADQLDLKAALDDIEAAQGDLSSSLDTKVPETRTINGQALDADITLSNIPTLIRNFIRC